MIYVTGIIISVRVIVYALIDVDDGERRNWLYALGLLGLSGSIVALVATTFPNL
jgi:hypothetical protein